MSWTCSLRDCWNDASEVPVIEFRVHKKHDPGEVAVGLTICAKHQTTFDLAELLREGIWDHILAICKTLKRAAPRQDLTTVRWVRKDSLDPRMKPVTPISRSGLN